MPAELFTEFGVKVDYVQMWALCRCGGLEKKAFAGRAAQTKNCPAA
jgi:hypothetical protein